MRTIKEIEVLVTDGHYDTALEAILELDEEQKMQHEVLNLLSIICIYSGEWKQAEEYCLGALQQNPENAEYNYNLIAVYQATYRYKDALALLEKTRGLTEDEEMLLMLEDIETDVRQAAAEVRTVLMAAYYFPPLAGSGVYRSLKFAKFLPENQWKPVVIAAASPTKNWNFADESLLSEIPACVSVHRLPDAVSTVSNPTLSSDEIDEMFKFLAQCMISDPYAFSLYMSVKNTENSESSLATFPDPTLNWAWKATNYIEANVKLEELDVIYTTSGPLSSHLIGLYFKKKYGIPWVADFRDEWSNNPYRNFDLENNVIHKLLYQLEKIVVTTADRTICVSEGAEMNYLRTFSIQPEQIVTITNGYDEEDFAGRKDEEERGKFRIVYSGLLYSRERSILPVLKALQQLDESEIIDRTKIEFVIMGNNDLSNLEQIQQTGMTDLVRLIPYSSHEEAIRLSRSGDLLLCLVGDDEKYNSVYTGKLFEYLRCGKPILSLSPANGLIAQVLESLDAGISVPSFEHEKISSFILDEYTKWSRQTSGTRNMGPEMERYERRTLTRSLAEVFNRVVTEQAD